MNESWPDIHAHARPIKYVDSTVACLSFQEILSEHIYEHSFSVGIHPWWTQNLSLHELDQLKKQIQILAQLPQSVAIGETGLDRLFKTTWDQQLELFHWHWELAEKLHLPMVIHKVRSGSDFLGLMKSHSPQTPWIFHDYHGTPDEIDHLLRLHSDCYFSFGESLLRHEGVSSLVKKISLDRLFIETDEGPRSQLSFYYEKMASLKELDVYSLSHQILINYGKVFKNS